MQTIGFPNFFFYKYSNLNKFYFKLQINTYIKCIGTEKIGKNNYIRNPILNN